MFVGSLDGGLMSLLLLATEVLQLLPLAGMTQARTQGLLVTILNRVSGKEFIMSNRLLSSGE